MIQLWHEYYYILCSELDIMYLDLDTFVFGARTGKIEIYGLIEKLDEL